MKQMHKLLTIDDLIRFCEEQNLARFSSKDFGKQICVQMPAVFSKSDNDDEDMMFANVLAFHTGNNRNRSSVTEDAAKKAMKDMAYKPVLANFCEIDGIRDFTSHDFDIDEDGNFVYYEKQVGCFTADKPYMKQDAEHEDRMNVYAKVAIPRQYTDAAEIIERKGGTNCSVEICVNELSWDSKEKTLVLNDIAVMGLTLLGKNPETGEDVAPGMENAHIQLEDFSMENNSITFNSKIINEIADAVANSVANRIGDLTTTERRNEPMDFEEIKEVTEETTEVMEETTEEETPAVIEEAVEDTPDVVEDVVDDFEEEEPSEKPNEEVTDEVDEVEEPDEENVEADEEVTEEFDGESSEEETEDEEDPIVDDDEQEPGYKKRTYSIDGMTFETSLSEILFAISELVNNTYSETDNDYYSVEVYEGSKNVVMIGWCSGRAYKQGYKVRNGVYSLVGDRVNVKAVYVTETEEAELDRMRSNYSDISDKLAKYESEPEKMEILNSSDYASIAGNADFAALKIQENHFDLTVDEVKEKADAMLLAYAKSGKLNFAATQPERNEEPKHDFFAFARFDTNSDFLDRVLKERR